MMAIPAPQRFEIGLDTTLEGYPVLAQSFMRTAQLDALMEDKIN